MLSDILLWLTRHLYPTGRIWNFPVGGFTESLHVALAKSEASCINDCTSILNSILPDNDNFTSDDATDWEKRLGLISNPLVSLLDRKMAIAAKMAGSGPQPAKQHYQFIQGELQDAGFDVYVYENIFPDGHGGYITKTPFEASGDPSILAKIRYGQNRYAQARYGQVYSNKIANSIYAKQDLSFDTGTGFESTFFIGGSTLGSFANIPTTRELEFRQLVLRLKPVQNVAFIFINYI